MEGVKKAQPVFRVLFVLIDGVGDNGIAELGMLTPLQAQEFHHFNALAAGGLNGLHDPVQSGLACGSDTAHMSMFGYDPFKYYKGRGAFESLGSGIDMTYEDIAFKSNFAYMNDSTGIVEKRRVDRHFEQWGLPLCPDLCGLPIPGYEKDYTVTVLHATEHRCGIKVSGPGLSADITGTDPIVDSKPLRKVVALDPADAAAVRTADIVNRLSDAIRAKLNAHPLNQARKAAGLPYSNVILLRGCGSKLQVDSFESKHGMKPFIIAPTAVIAGIGKTFGMDIKIAPGATGDYGSNFFSKASVAVETLKQGVYDFCFLHVKGVDDSGHDGSTSIKSELLKRLNDMVGKLLKELRAHEVETHDQVKYILVLTGDHTTPVKNKEHSYEPVPLVVTSVTSAYCAQNPAETADPLRTLSRIDQLLCTLRDGVSKFNELEAAKGSLGRCQGSEILGIVKRFKLACLQLISSQS